jgi:CRISPR system Cascade subunit CasE
MLTLSLLTLNPHSRQVQAEIRDPYQMHRTLSKAFPEGEAAQQTARCLFRVEEDKHGWRVLVQSRTPPDWGRLTAGSDYLLVPPQTKTLAPQFSVGQTLAFRLRANPTKRESQKAEGKRLGNRVGLYTEEDRLAWLTRKGEMGGFALCSANAASQDRIQSRTRAGHQATFGAVQFDGVLRVTDPAALLVSLEGGVGAGKGVGFGLLSLAWA